MVELGRRILNKIPNSLSLIVFRFLITIKKWKQIQTNRRELNRIINGGPNYNRDFLDTIKDYIIYCSHIGAGLYIKSYFEGSKLIPISLKMQSELGLNSADEIRGGNYIKSTDVILICCVKNDVERIQAVVEHHKSIGIDKMVFVDNMSNDGTREYLMTQAVDLYSIDELYHAGRKAEWIRKVQDIYGYNRWYLVVDSDELFSYVGMEIHPIADLVKYAEHRNIIRVRSMLLDMYPKHALYSTGIEVDDRKPNQNYSFVEDYRFFDNKTYYDAKDGRGYMVRGGPRKRVFGKNLDHSEPLGKYPLFFASIEDIWDDHRPLPYEKNFNSLFISVLRHYKFMAGDLEKYKSIAKEGLYYNGSSNYKVYLASGKDISFYYIDSVEFSSSESLASLEFLDKIDWSVIK